MYHPWSSSSFFKPMTSFFQEHTGIILSRPVIGDIWQAEEAADAFDDGKIRSLSFGLLDKDDGEEEDVKYKDDDDNDDDNAVDEDNSSSSSSSSSSNGNEMLGILFRNDSPVNTLLLCWVSENGDLHHFYRLPPSTTAVKDYTIIDIGNGHMEYTNHGDAFCVAYVENEEDIKEIQKSKSLFGHDNKVPVTVIAGYRSFARSSSSSGKDRDRQQFQMIYDDRLISGWPCRVEPTCFDDGKISEQKLERDIAAAAILLPPHARKYLKSHCKIWVNKSLSWGPKSCPVKGRGCCYHPSKEWLLQNGLCGDKHKCVEINDAPFYRNDCDLWGVGGVMLHELSHAYHHGMLQDGYSNKEIQHCYDLAMKEGLYDCVRVHGSQGPEAEAYACTNSMEYFAELSTAFLGGTDDGRIEYNKWFPFNRKELAKHDPRAHALLSRLWKVDVGMSPNMK
ncbi:hypothetical protein FRACYDRAFT_234740 [Fragilariopsis cylindrus CCMP1102]|uniref:Uncharacterized protein n=1 Tax=Fragilariopsis cylindrus CCMP1102 TaxID=635003 RepID=A0A1E7FTG7_9STRA|nr:hypothetical protein FRACYDRAFT_234740 [Fragilariopsis cylindrus CCMP1102]|eukprot:OEU21113.1 hypothetical protein FRACYDRAFT_234740 [Fragilariopsis cylindrus CCMP1102]